MNAFSSLDRAPDNIRNPRFYIYRAGLLLTVGRVDEAGVDIKAAMETKQQMEIMKQLHH